jgi:hypothetical protein
MLTRIVLYSTLGTLLSVLGHTWDSTEFWCFLGLFWACESLARQDGEAIGVGKVLDMHIMKIANLKRMIKKLEAGEDLSYEELHNEIRKDNKDYDNKDN